MTRALINGKDICTDWVESMFDDGQVINLNHHVIGTIKGCVVSCKWDDFTMTWKVSKDMGGDYVSAFILLEQRLVGDAYEQTGFQIDIEHTETPYELTQKFWFLDEED